MSIGYAEWEHNGGEAGTAGADYTGEGMSVAFNVNDSLTVSYGTLEDNKEADSANKNTLLMLISIQSKLLTQWVVWLLRFKILQQTILTSLTTLNQNILKLTFHSRSNLVRS